MPEKFKAVYGTDPKNQGFFWVESEQKRQEAWSVRRNSPADFQAVYQCAPGQRAGIVFLESDLSFHYKPPLGLILGPMVQEVKDFISRGHMIIQSWDTAFSTTTASAWTVCVTALLVNCMSYHLNEDPNEIGPCDPHFDVIILDVLRRRMDFADLIPVMKLQAKTWNPQEIVIEKKASGFDAISVLSKSNMPIFPVSPVEGKRQRAVNSVGLKTAGSAQGWFRQGRVLTPDPNAVPIPWFDKWKEELRDFSGSDDVSSDQVDSTVHLVRRAIQLGAGAIILPSGWSPERSIVPAAAADPMLQRVISPQTDPRAVLLAAIGNLSSQNEDPFYGMCGRCLSYKSGICASAESYMANRAVTAFDSCSYFSLPGEDNTFSITSILPTGIVRV